MPPEDPGSSPAKRSDREHLNLDPFIVEMRIYYGEPLECTDEQWPRLREILDRIWKRYIDAHPTDDRHRMLDGTLEQYSRLKRHFGGPSDGQGNDAVSLEAVRPGQDPEEAGTGNDEAELHQPRAGDAAPE